MLQLVFKHLMPLEHVMNSQRYRAVATGKTATAEIESYLRAAPDKFLSMIPACCVFDDEQSGFHDLKDSSLDHSGNVYQSPSGFSVGSTNRHRRGSFSSLASTDIFAFTNQPQKIIQELSYLQYLQDARRSLASCSSASVSWSSSYDGTTQPPPLGDSASFDMEDEGKETSLASLPPRADDFEIPEFSITRLPKKALDSEEDLESPEKKRKREDDSGVSALETDTCDAPSSDVSPCDISNALTLRRQSSPTFETLPSDIQRAPTPPNICDITMEETLKELDVLFAAIEQTSQSSETEDRSIEAETASQPDEGYCPDPLSQFMDPLSEGASDTLGKIQRNSSTNDPERMEGGLGKVFSETELSSKPSRSSSSSLLDEAPSPRPSTYRDLVSSIDKEGNSSPSSPSPSTVLGNSIGPFLQALLLKLEGMLHNSYSVNLLLTGVIIRLAAYPQPIIRSFLLHPNLVFQPNVKSLIQVLNTLKQRLDHFSYTVDNFEDLLGKSKRFLRLRELESGIHSGAKVGGQVNSRFQPRQTINSPSNFSTPKPSPEKESSRFRILTDLFRSASSRKVDKDKKRSQLQMQMQQRRQEMSEISGDGRSYRYFATPQVTTESLDDDPIFNAMTRAEATKLKNAVFSAIVLEEFLKELAAMAQEQALLMMEAEV